MFILLFLLACAPKPPVVLPSLEPVAQAWIGNGTVRGCDTYWQTCDVVSREGCEMVLTCSARGETWICTRNPNYPIACPGGRTTVEMK